MPSKPRLYLIDGHALAYRAYFALTATSDGSRWITKSGEPTAGVYGFTSVLIRLLEQDAPEYIAVSFDTGRTFRDDIYPEYKATREKTPEDLVPQFDRIRQVVRAFGIPILEAEGFEADDVLGTVAGRVSKEGVHVTIITGDRDLLQLADRMVTIRLAGQKLSEAVDYGPKEVEERFGIKVGQFVDYKALVGDTSDNIPGVRGIGEKSAVSLLQEYGTLDRIPGGAGSDSAQQMRLFEAEHRSRPTAIVQQSHVIDQPEALEGLARRLTKAKQIAFDVETTSTDPMRAEGS